MTGSALGLLSGFPGESESTVFRAGEAVSAWVGH